jgi:hypothetical protein
MSALPEAKPDPDLDRLVAALVDWGATASQLVSHMELSERSGASTASRSVVEVFSSLLTQTLGPKLAGREKEIGRAAALIEEVDRTVAEELFVVPLAPAPRRRGNRRRPH